MRLTVLYFGVLKDQIGKGSDAIVVEDGLTVGALVLFLEESASKQSDIWKTLAVAVNREYASSERVLRDGDEVALLPPVSGGGRSQ